MVPLSQFQSLEEKTWVLTFLLIKGRSFPIIPLQDCFQGAMQALEDQSKQRFPSSIKERIWSSIAPVKLIEVNESLAYTLVEKVSKEFKEEEIDEMLLMIQGDKCPRNNLYRFRYDCLYRDNQHLLQERTVKKVRQIASQWKKELVEALQNEGIQFRSS